MFIDDTGNVHTGAMGNPQARYAGIVGVIFEIGYLTETFDKSFNKLKERHFGLLGGKAPILHLRRMKKAEGPFSHLSNECCRHRWEDACFSMYRRAKYSVITVCVDKEEFKKLHPEWPGTFYSMLIGNAIERYFYFLKDRSATGDIMVEATNSSLDAEIDRHYNNFYHNGTEHIRGEKIRARLSSERIKIKPKSANIPGLQFADLLAATCFSHCKKIYAAGADYDKFAMKVADLLESEKFYRANNGSPHGYGTVWRP